MTSGQARGGAVLSLGRIYCDLIFTGLPAMPRLGREVFAEGMTLSLGGGAFITAAHSAAHGRTTALVARFGTDALSAAISRVVGKLDIRDMTVSETNTDEIVREIYRSGSAAVTA